MIDLIKRRTSPALVIAVLALVAAVSGAAVASPTAGTSKKALTPAKVRAIADAEIAAKAPGLSVASAKSADNASQLGGVGPGGYQRKVLFAVVDGGGLAIVRSNASGATLDISGPVGTWDINFNSGDLDNCAAVASLADPSFNGAVPAGEAGTGQGLDTADAIHITTRNSAGTLTDLSFAVTVVC
jgi:hypothetical protein